MGLAVKRPRPPKHRQDSQTPDYRRYQRGDDRAAYKPGRLVVSFQEPVVGHDRAYGVTQNGEFSGCKLSGAKRRSVDKTRDIHDCPLVKIRRQP